MTSSGASGAEHLRVAAYDQARHELHVATARGRPEVRVITAPFYYTPTIYALGGRCYLLIGIKLSPLFMNPHSVLSTPTGAITLETNYYIEAQHPLYPRIFLHQQVGRIGRWYKGPLIVSRLRPNGQWEQLFETTPRMPRTQHDRWQFVVSWRIGPQHIQPVRIRSSPSHMETTSAMADDQGRPASITSRETKDNVAVTRKGERRGSRVVLELGRRPAWYHATFLGVVAPLLGAEGQIQVGLSIFDRGQIVFPVDGSFPAILDDTTYRFERRYRASLIAILPPDLVRYVLRAV